MFIGNLIFINWKAKLAHFLTIETLVWILQSPEKVLYKTSF